MLDSKFSQSVRPDAGAATESPRALAEPCRLQPGDVLLSSGTGWIEQAIQHFDDCPVSHAAIVASDSQVLEATAAGIDCRTFVPNPQGSRRSIVRRSDPELPPRISILSSAWERAAMGDRYAYDPILLLAIILLVREARPSSHLAPLVRSVLELASTTLSRSLLGDGKRPLLSPWFLDEAALRTARPGRPAASAAGGLHSKGLLSWILGETARSDAASRDPRPGRTRKPAASSAAALVKEAESRFQRHLESLGAAADDAAAEPREKASFMPSVMRLASTLYSALLLTQELVDESDRRAPREQAAIEAEERAEGEVAGTPFVLAQFSRLASSLITPGDVLRSPRLVTVGSIVLL